MTIFLTTHHLEEAEKLCQSIAIMDRGRILACGETEQVRASLNAGHQYRIRVRHLNSNQRNSVSSIREDLVVTEVDDRSIRSENILELTNAPDTATINKVIDILRDNNIEIIDVIKHEMSLSEIFSHYVDAGSRYSSGRQDRSESKESHDIVKPPNLALRGDFSFSGILIPHVILAFLKRDWRLETSYRVSFFLQFVGIFFSVTMFYFISELFGKAADPYLTPYGSDYFSFVLIGIAFSGYLGVGISAFSQKIRSAQTTGTLEAMIATPTRYSTIIFSSALWDFLHTTFRVVVYLGIGILFMGVRFPNPNFLSALIILMLSILAFSSLGIIAASFIMVLKRGDPVTWLISSISSLLGGVYYPVTILPLGLQWLAYMVPITYSLHAMRLALLQGASFHLDIGFDVPVGRVEADVAEPRSYDGKVYARLEEAHCRGVSERVW